jgi:hypothetical protein
MTKQSTPDCKRSEFALFARICLTPSRRRRLALPPNQAGAFGWALNDFGCGRKAAL